MIPTRRKRQRISEEMGLSLHFLDKVAVGFRKYPERYPNGIIQSGHMAIIDVEMMLDWIKYRDALDAGAEVPAFKREEYQQ